MAVKDETRIVRAIIRHLTKEYDFDGYHVHGSILQRRGEPDLYGSINTRVGYVPLHIEVKTPTGEPTPVQILRIKEYHRRGYCITGIVDSVRGTDNLVKAYVDYWYNGGTLNPTGNGLTHYLERYDVEDKYGLYT